MPYKNIQFVKLEKRLLNDHRWYMMSEGSQLIYIKLMLLAAQSYNCIPKKTAILKLALRTILSETEIESAIIEIRSSFPKLKQNKYVYYFLGFEEKTNYIPKRENLRKTLGNPRELVEKEEDKDKEEDKEEDKDKEEEIERKTYFGKHVNMYMNDYNDLCERFTKSIIDDCIEKINDWIASKGKKPFKDYPATIRNWIKRDNTKGETYGTRKKENSRSVGKSKYDGIGETIKTGY